MNRQALEALSTPELQRLITDAVSVLAARAESAGAGSSEPAEPAAAAGAAAGLFTFGAASSSAAAAGRSNPFAVGSSGGLFGASGGPLFGGTGGGLFSELGGNGDGQCAKASAFAPPCRAGGAEAVKADGPKAAAGGDGEKPAGEAGEDADGEDEAGLVPHEEVLLVQGWTPSITLEVRDSIETGEEGEEQLYSQRSKLYRFRDGEWKERGLGEARLLKDKTTGKVRFLLRQDKTGKVAANFFVIDRKPYCDLRPNADSEKIWVWGTPDFSDGEANVEEFALKFATVELAGKFKEAFEDAKQQNSKVMDKELKAKGVKDSKEESHEPSK